MELTEKLKTLLAKIQDGVDTMGVVYLPDSRTKDLEIMGLIEVNPDLKQANEDGERQVRVTPEGTKVLIEFYQEQGEAAEQPTKAPTPSLFDQTEPDAPVPATHVPVPRPEKVPATDEFDLGIPVPTVRRTKRSSVQEKLDRMEVGHSFHKPMTEDGKNPAKNLASQISNANNRYKNDDGTFERKFICRAVGPEDIKGEGARVFRVE